MCSNERVDRFDETLNTTCYSALEYELKQGKWKVVYRNKNGWKNRLSQNTERKKRKVNREKVLGKMKSRRVEEREGGEEMKTCSLRDAVASSQNPHQTQIACPVLHHEAGQDKKGTAHKDNKVPGFKR